MTNNTFECDKNKARSNYKKHRIKFTEAARVFAGHTLTAASNSTNAKEKRFITIGTLSATEIIVLIWTPRGNNLRIISVRKARSKEKENYHANIKKTLN